MSSNLAAAANHANAMTTRLKKYHRQPNESDSISSPDQNGFKVDLRSPDEINFDELYKLKDELTSLEEYLESYRTTDKKISFKDIDVFLKHFGAPMKKKDIEFFIWEVDENGDGLIDWDEVYTRECFTEILLLHESLNSFNFAL